MGRFVVTLFLLIAIGMVAVNGISFSWLDPRGVGTRIEGREVVLGSRAGDYYLVHSGLDEGERVVTRGAFKIDSALQIMAKPSMMNPKGGAKAESGHHQHH